jgi:hypothetical protein
MGIFQVSKSGHGGKLEGSVAKTLFMRTSNI